MRIDNIIEREVNDMSDIEKELEDIVGGGSEIGESAQEYGTHKIADHVEIYYEYSILNVKRSFGGQIISIKRNKYDEWKFYVYMDTDGEYTGWYPLKAIEGYVYPSSEAVMEAKGYLK